MTTTPSALTAQQWEEIIALLPGSDSVELKVTVTDDKRRSVIRALGIDPLKAEIRQVAFFDTPDLLLNRSGVVVRARRIQRASGDAIVKLRPVVPSALTSELRQAAGFGVELDVMPGSFVCSARMKVAVEDKLLRKVFRGDKPVRRALTREQRSLFADHAPDGVDLDDLIVLGPLDLLKVKFKPEGFPRAMVGELWFYPDGSRILELSTKCRPDEAREVGQEAREFIAAHGVDLAAPQQTKTRTALELLAPQT